MPPAKSGVICCVPQCSSRANRKENINLHAPPKCMILRTSTTRGNFFKYFSIFRRGLDSGGGLQGAGNIRKCPQSKIPGFKKVILPPPHFKPPMLLAGPGNHIFFRQRIFVYALAFLAVFVPIFRQCIVNLMNKKNESR